MFNDSRFRSRSNGLFIDIKNRTASWSSATPACPHATLSMAVGCCCLLYALAAVPSARAQPEVRLIADDVPPGFAYRTASQGSYSDGDFLLLAGPGVDRLPVESGHAYSGQNSGLLGFRHIAGGSWEMNLEADDGIPFDLMGFDSLIVFVNGPDSVAGAELPRLLLVDAHGVLSSPIWMSTPEDVRVDAATSGFTDGSTTDVVLAASYLNALDPDQRRAGYPANLVISFADTPVDTSRGAIGAPATPARFTVTTEGSSDRLEFSFRDLNADYTLSQEGEFIDILLPEEDADMKLRPTWRIAVTNSQPPLVVPASGDLYRLVLAFSEFTLDADVASWQPVRISLQDMLASPGFSPSEVMAIRFLNGGSNPEVRTLWIDYVVALKNDDEAFLDELQRLAFNYFWYESNPLNGLVKDRSTPGSASSIAAVGFGLSAYTVGVDRGWITRQQARERVLTTLRFFWQAPQSTASDATGYKGFFYHFLDMDTGRRRGTTELSTVDTALLLAGVLHVREYFSDAETDEDEIRALADSIYARVDWPWAQVRPPRISHGWRPESGFIAFDWVGYNEAMIVYILALGSPTHPVEPSAWTAWTSGYDNDWQTHYGYTFLTFPPLFGHQYSHVWIDFRDIQDAFMRQKGIDYFENSRRATLAQREYHISNPGGWPNYGPDEWGLTASDIPGGYRARGAPPPQNDDGTLAPTAPGGSIAFTPDQSIATLRKMKESYPGLWGPYGFRDAYNVSQGWIATDYLGIDQGPILLMAENYRTGRVWEVSMRSEAVRRGLEAAGFQAVTTDVESETSEPLHLLESYPNPFSERTTIRYRMPRPGRVVVAVYDLLGREVSRLVDASRPAGLHSVPFERRGLPSGVYICRVQSSSGTLTRKLVVSR